MSFAVAGGPSIAVRRVTAPAGLLAVALFAAGCDGPQSAAPPPAAAPEASFAAQAEAVRDGRSEQIRLDHTSVDDDDLAALDGLEENLRRINLSHSDITNAGLAQIAGMRNLNHLRLASERITDEGLAALARLEALRHLHLIDAPITDAGLEHLHALANLESLYLDGTRATDKGRQRLVEALPGVHLHFDGGHHRADPRADDHGQ